MAVSRQIRQRSTESCEIVTVTSRAGSAKVTLRGPIEHLQEVWKRGEFFEQRLLEYIYWHYNGGTFVDVGSALGNHSLFFAKFCRPKMVVSVESVVESVWRQQEIYELNDVQDRIHIHNCALSNVRGWGHMEPFASENLGQFQLVKEGNETPIETLDYITEKIEGRVTLVKIDVEDHELKVLRGATKLLSEKKPALFVEIRSRLMYDAIVYYLAKFGYHQVGSVFQDATVFEFTI